MKSGCGSDRNCPRDETLIADFEFITNLLIIRP